VNLAVQISSTMADYSNLPDFDSLPKVENMPQGCAWGVFDKDGKKDRLGCLNLLTPKVVQEAFKEARDGVSISLNWPIGAINTPGFHRKGLVHKVLSFKEGPYDLWGFDDELEFNTQCSSQWDSLVHFAHQPTGLSYNGVLPARETLTQSFGNVDLKKSLPTLNHWHERGGLVGRGVLLDYRAYAEAKGIKYSCFENHPISAKALDAVAEFQGTKFKHGDILIVRSGFTEDLGTDNAEEQEKRLGTHQSVGVQGNKESARWVWNHHFAAVAGDAIAFESLPPILEDENNRAGTIGDLGKSAISTDVHYHPPLANPAI